MHLEIIATIYCSTIFTSHVYSLYSHLCIYLSVYHFSYPSTPDISGLVAGGGGEKYEVHLRMTTE
jgi:hypothetical protein